MKLILKINGKAPMDLVRLLAAKFETRKRIKWAEVKAYTWKQYRLILASLLAFAGLLMMSVAILTTSVVIASGAIELHGIIDNTMYILSWFFGVMGIGASIGQLFDAWHILAHGISCEEERRQREYEELKKEWGVSSEHSDTND